MSTSSKTRPPSGSVDIVDLVERALPKARVDTHQVLAETARVRDLDPGEAVFRESEPLPLTMVLRGFGAFRRTTVDGRQLTLGLARQGDLFGFGSLASRPASVDLVVLSNARVATWVGRELRMLVADDPGLALDIIDRMSFFLVSLTERLDGFLHQDARRRVMRVLAQYRDLFFGEQPILSRTDLPSLVGTSREMTSRVLRELEDEGVIVRIGRRGLRLLAPDRLDEHERPEREALT